MFNVIETDPKIKVLFVCSLTIALSKLIEINKSGKENNSQENILSIQI